MTTKPIVDELDQGVVSQLEFLDLFDLEEIRKIQDAFAVAAGVASVITYPDGRPITRPANFSRLCSEVIRKTEKGLADCLHFHSELGCNNPNGLTIKSCFIRGLWVGCAGISVGEKHIANWIVGQVRSDTPDTEEIIRYAGEIGADEQEFRFALEEIMVMPFNRFEQVCNFLFIMANLMSKIAFQKVSHASHIRQIEEADIQRLDDDDRQVEPESVHKDIMEVLPAETDSGKVKTEAGFRLLVVDDDPVCLSVCSVQLAESGYLITQALNGKQALEKIREADVAGELFDLVLLDVVMPNMSGYEVCRILRKKYSSDILPVLMLTVKDRVEDRLAGLDAGANDYLAKPFSSHELQARIHTHVSLKKSVEERKKLETQLRRAQKVEAMGTMAGGFAHDFNNILGIILGNTELALEDIPKSNPVKFNLEEVRIACMRAKDVVSQIHSFAGRTEGKMKPVRITPIVRESVKMLRASIPATIDINLDVTAENDMIMADPARIHQMTVNLVNNAAFEMWETGGILNIGIENVAINRYGVAVYDDISPGKYVRLTVRDTGKGIDPKIIDLIFDPYFTTKKIGQGAGMGLSVVQGIVGNHNGRVMAESEPGQGATFQVFFPVVEKKSNLSGESGKDMLAGNERILFVDDEPSLAKLGEIILNRLGYSVVSVAGTIKALEIFEADPDGFDLLVTDYAMPDMSGVILAKRIKKIRPDIPVILCTGFNEHVTDEKIMAECISTVMIKPINRLTLSGTVREVLDKRPCERLSS